MYLTYDYELTRTRFALRGGTRNTSGEGGKGVETKRDYEKRKAERGRGRPIPFDGKNRTSCASARGVFSLSLSLSRSERGFRRGYVNNIHIRLFVTII